MATFIEPKFPVASKPRRGVKPPNHTLEDVAEEVLNGMFCHYEPPDPDRSTKRKKKAYRSILRRRGDTRSSRPDRLTRRVRWVDEVEAVVAPDDLSPGANSDSGAGGHRPVSAPSPMESHNGCGVVQACLDAGLEVGCYTSRADNGGLPPVPKMNAQQAIAVARAKSPRANAKTSTPEIVFDDEGNPRYASSEESPLASPVPPPPITPPAPPPNKKEIFFPELCGVRINCMDDDLVLASTTSSSPSLNVNDRGPIPNQPNRRRSSQKDMDDAENSIIYEDDEESETSDEEEEVYQAAPPRYKAPAAASLSKAQPKKTIRQVIEEYEDSDDGKEADWENTSAVSSTFFRRVWSRNKDKAQPLDTIKETKSPPKPSNVSRVTRNEQPVSRPSKPLNDFDPVEMDRSESKTKVAANFGGFLKRNQSPSRPLSVVENSDWDDNIPIVQSGSGENVAQRESGSPPRPATKQDIPIEKPSLLNRRRSRSLERPSRKETILRSFSPTRRRGSTSISNGDHREAVANSRSLDSTKESLPESQLHPAHPLVNPKSGRELDKDDILERQSYITAHRHGFDDTETKAATLIQDDILERQSMITDHRNGFEGKDQLPPGPNTKDMSARAAGRLTQRPLVESNDTGNKSRMLRGRKSAIKPQSQPRVEPTVPRAQHSSPAVPTMSHDDMLERMSFITASRKGMEMPNTEPSPPRNWSGSGSAMNTGRVKHHIDEKRGRSRSPFRRSRSFEQEYEAVHQQAMPPYNYIPNDPRHPSDSFVYNAHQPMADRRNSTVPNEKHAPFNPGAQLDRSNMAVTHGSNQSHAGNDRARHSFPAGAPYDNYAASQYHPGFGLPVDPNNPMQQNPHGQTMQHPMSQQQMMYHPMVSNNTVSGTGPMPPQQHWMGQDYSAFTGDAANHAAAVNASEQQQQTNPPIDDTTQAEPELTWEERTRQAWERLRGGMAALAFDTPKETKSADSTVDTAKKDASILQSSVPEMQSTFPQPHPHPPLSPGQKEDVYNMVQSPSHPREQFLPRLHQQSTDMRRVSFGAPQQMIYYDNQDENQTLMSHPSYPGQTKKKKKFRGTKLVTGVFDKMKNSLAKVSLSRSLSSDSNGYPLRNNSSQLSDWEAGRMHPNDPIFSPPPHPVGYSNAQQTMYTHPNASFTLPDSFQQQGVNNGLQQQQDMNNGLQQHMMSGNLPQQHMMMSSNPPQQHMMHNSLQQRQQLHVMNSTNLSNQFPPTTHPNGYVYDPRQNYGYPT